MIVPAPEGARAVTIFDNGVIRYRHRVNTTNWYRSGTKRESARFRWPPSSASERNGADDQGARLRFQENCAPEEREKRPRKRSKYEASKAKITTLPPRFRQGDEGASGFAFARRKIGDEITSGSRKRKSASSALPAKFFGEINKRER